MELRFELFLVIGIFSSGFISSTFANNEHKVHNIVLYPDKHSWCKTTPIKQVVAYPGCNSIEMDNNVCVGACFSYSIPRTVPSSPGEVLPYCDSCQPSNTNLKHVTLKCTSGDYEGEIMVKKVEIITNCSCSTCSDPTRKSPFDVEDESDSSEKGDSLFDVPQLINLIAKDGNESAETFKSAPPATINDTLISERLSFLMRALNEGNDGISVSEKIALRQLLDQFENKNRKADDTTLEHLIKRIENDGHINVNYKQLKDILINMDLSEKDKRHQDEVRIHQHHRHQHMHGPHHSQIIEAESHDMIRDGVYLHPALHVASHELKPAIPGTEISYHGNLLHENEREDTSTDFRSQD